MIKIISISIWILFFSQFICLEINAQNIENKLILSNGKTIKSRISTPNRYKRIINKKNSFGEYLRNPAFLLHYQD